MAKKAVLIGIDKYPTNSLKGCKNDAVALYNLLRKNFDDSVNFEAKVYSDDIQTQDQLLELATDLFADRHEVALFYFSGHGALTNRGSYVVTPDHGRYNKGVAVRDLLQLAALSPSDSKIIILDCCYAGAAGEFNSHFHDSLLSKDTIILAASRPNEYAAMIGGRSVFTNLILEALQGGAADLFGQISPGSLYAYIDRSLGSFSQRPVFKANVERLITLRRVAPPIPISYLRELTKLFTTPDYLFPLDKSYEPTESEYAIPENVRKFKIFQEMNRVGLVVPHEEDHLYWAAINEKWCKLTAIGKHYWFMNSKDLF